MNNSQTKIIIITIILILGIILGMILNFINSNNSLLFPDSNAIFSDYIDTAKATQKTYDIVGGARNYFPFIYILLNIVNVFTILGFNLLTVYFITFALTICFLLYFLKYFLKNIKWHTLIILVLTFLTYPLWFLFNRGNIEYFVFAFLILFFLLYQNKNYKLAAIILAFPICIKLYPAVFSMLFLKNKKYKEFFIATLSSILLMILSYTLLGGNFSKIPILLENFLLFTEKYALHIRGIPFGHSIWNLLNYIGINFETGSTLFLNSFNMSLYNSIILFSSILLFLYVVFIEKTDWKAISILTIMMISFPHVSFDYTLIHLLIPLTFFIVSTSTKKWETIFYSIIFSLLLIPMNLCVFTNKVNIINIGVFIRPLLFIVMILTIIISNYYKKTKGVAT